MSSSSRRPPRVRTERCLAVWLLLLMPMVCFPLSPHLTSKSFFQRSHNVQVLCTMPIPARSDQQKARQRLKRQCANENQGITYSHAAGTQSIDPASPLVNKPFSLDTTMWIASCTKLLTSLAALQCVERGLLKPDGDISEVRGDTPPDAT